MMSQDRGWKTISILLIISNAVLVMCLCALACLVLAGVGLAAYEMNSILGGASPETTAVSVGQPAPDFQLSDLDGKPVSLKQYGGHPVLLNFWATWCGPCKEEMPLIVQRYLKYQPDLIVLAVDEGESVADVRTFLKENALPFIILMDETEEVGGLYGVYGYPTTLFIDASGIVQAVEIGSMSSDTIDRDLLLVGVP